MNRFLRPLGLLGASATLVLAAGTWAADSAGPDALQDAVHGLRRANQQAPATLRSTSQTSLQKTIDHVASIHMTVAGSEAPPATQPAPASMPVPASFSSR